MVVTEDYRAAAIRRALVWTQGAPVPALSSAGSVALAMYRQAETGEAWPVSGDATARGERHRLRRTRDKLLRPLGRRRALLAAGWLKVPATGAKTGTKTENEAKNRGITGFSGMLGKPTDPLHSVCVRGSDRGTQ